MRLYVDWRESVALTGTVVKWLAVAMLVPLVTGLLYGGDVVTFLTSMAIVVAIGVGLEQFGEGDDIGPREALLFVALAWIVVSVVGAIPYLIASWGSDATIAHPINALFESTSGFTTTGATVLGAISVDAHSHALMMWRQLTQWLGGMGIIVLMIAILPEIAVNGAQLMRSEAPGPELQKLTPRIAETARVLWLVYLAFTLVFVLLMVALHLLEAAPDMDFYNAVAHGFSTMPTGGFSPQVDSIAAFSPIVQWAFVPFMVVAGINFALWWHVLRGETANALGDRELHTYLGMIVLLIGVLFALLFAGAAGGPQRLGGATFGVVENALRQAVFQIASLMNSTGFATSDFAQWETEGQILLLFAMFVGGSAGSTGGGIKVIRWLVVVKAARRELHTASHPSAVEPIRLGHHVVDEDAVRGVLGFTFLYILLFALGMVVFALDASRVEALTLAPLDAASASLATLGNIGPGFGDIGPFGSYVDFPDTSKLLMIVYMIVGRLEIIPVLVLFTGPFWRR